MENTKTITILCLLTSALIAPLAIAESPTVLLKQGIYVEETEGDLDKAIGIYKQVLEKAAETERLASRATFQLGMCHLKKGEEETAAKYFQQVVSKYPTQKTLVKKAAAQLKKIKPETKESVFEEVDYQVTRFMGEKFGETAAQAGQSNLMVNSQVYFVDRDGFLYNGGLNAYYNWTGRTITKKVHFGGTSYPNQTHYGIDGNKLNTEIVPDKTRPNHWQVYWIPDEPLPPEESLYYGWSMNNKKKLPQLPGDTRSLKMQNMYGMAVVETFFLVLPKDVEIAKSNPPTSSKELLNFNVYWWTKQVQQNENHVEHVQLGNLPASSTEDILTQEGHNTIDADGLIHFKSAHRVSNNCTEPITTDGFINSDFVSRTKMYEEDGTEIPFETTHEGNIYRYRITFNKPIMPGESFVYYTEGTKSGLIKPVGGSKDVFQYSMVHSPNAGQSVLCISTYLLPEGAKFVSTSTPHIQKTEKDGRVELRVEKVVPANGSIATEFKYEIPKPLILDPAPWTDGEIMELRLKKPNGKEYGTIIYSAQIAAVDDIETWQIISHMHVTEGNLSQYTFVEAEAESFAPLVGQTINWMGDFLAEYTKDSVKLTTNGTTKDHPVTTIVHDNEQALYLIRRMPLAENYHGKFPIFAAQGGALTVECQIKVLAVEDVTVEAGSYTCYKTSLSIHYGGAVTLQHTLWFSADEHKHLVKYDVGGAATMELITVWQHQKDQPLTHEDTEQGFSVSIPSDWRFYKYCTALQLMAPDLKPWALFTWQERGTDPDSASALTIAKADSEKLKDSFTKYTVDPASWTEFTLSGLEAAQYIATYKKSGTGLKAYPKPKDMVEYRTYILNESTVYWFVFRIEKDDFEESKDTLDYIINSFQGK